MQSLLAAHVDQFLYAPQPTNERHSNIDTNSNGEDDPFDCETPIKPSTKPPLVLNAPTAKMSEYSFDDGPSFDCEGPSEFGEGIKVDLHLMACKDANSMGITPIKSNKTINTDTQDDATAMTEPISPSPFKTPSSSLKKSSSVAGRGSQQAYLDEESPFDETPFDEGICMEQEDATSRLDTGIASPTVATTRAVELDEQEPGPLIPRVQNGSTGSHDELMGDPLSSSSPSDAIDTTKSVSFRLPSEKANRRRKDELGTSAHSASSCEEDADADYEADVERLHFRNFGSPLAYPYSDDDDTTVCTALSENSSLPTVKKRGGRQVVLSDLKRSSKKNGIEEWCLNNVFDNISTDAALDMADWLAKEYAKGGKNLGNNVKTLMYDCLVPLKENGISGKSCCGDDGEVMVQLLRPTHERSDLHLQEVCLPKKMTDRQRQHQSTKDDIPRLRSKKVDRSIQESMPSEVQTETRKLAVPTVLTRTRSLLEDIPTNDDNMIPEEDAAMIDFQANFRAETSTLATPSVLTRTRSLLEDIPANDDTIAHVQDVATDDFQAMVEANLAGNSFDSNSTAVTENLSVHQHIEKDDDGDNSVRSNRVEQSLAQFQEESRKLQHQQQIIDDDDKVLDQAFEMAALAQAIPSTLPPPPQPETVNSPEDRDSDTNNPSAQKEERPETVNSLEDRDSDTNTPSTQKEERPEPYKITMSSTQGLTMAKAKEVLKAAKANGGVQAYPMFLEMEPEPKYANMEPKKKTWPPPKKTDSEAVIPNSYKPTPRKSKPVDRYLAALKDKSNSQKQVSSEEWW